MKVDICIFVFAIISTSVHSCQPGGGAGGGEGDTTTAKTEEFSRKKRNAGLGTSEKCSSVEFDVITDQKNTPEKTLNNSGELELKIKSLQQGFDNTLDSMKLQKAGGEKLKATYKVNADCDALRHLILNALIEIKTIQMIVVKCECEPSFVLYKKDFKRE